MSDARRWARWRFLVSPRWLGWHLAIVVCVAGMLALGWWQFSRAEDGNSLSWAYTFEWPLFAGFAVVFWAKTIKDEVSPPAAADGVPVGPELPVGAVRAAAGPGGGPAAGDEADEDAAELAAYNAYLARLHQEAQGHGRWHGLR
jgi:hypothetical protein